MNFGMEVFNSIAQAAAIAFIRQELEKEPPAGETEGAA